jgi:hypothetical protein
MPSTNINPIKITLPTHCTTWWTRSISKRSPRSHHSRTRLGARSHSQRGPPGSVPSWNCRRPVQSPRTAPLTARPTTLGKQRPPEVKTLLSAAPFVFEGADFPSLLWVLCAASANSALKSCLSPHPSLHYFFGSLLRCFLFTSSMPSHPDPSPS